MNEKFLKWYNSVGNCLPNYWQTICWRGLCYIESAAVKAKWYSILTFRPVLVFPPLYRIFWIASSSASLLPWELNWNSVRASSLNWTMATYRDRKGKLLWMSKFGTTHQLIPWKPISVYKITSIIFFFFMKRIHTCPSAAAGAYLLCPCPNLFRKQTTILHNGTF